MYREGEHPCLLLFMCEEFEFVRAKKVALSVFFFKARSSPLLCEKKALFISRENEREPYLVISDFFFSREPPHSFTLHFLYHTHTHTHT